MERSMSEGDQGGSRDFPDPPGGSGESKDQFVEGVMAEYFKHLLKPETYKRSTLLRPPSDSGPRETFPDSSLNERASWVDGLIDNSFCEYDDDYAQEVVITSDSSPFPGGAVDKSSKESGGQVTGVYPNDMFPPENSAFMENLVEFDDRPSESELKECKSFYSETQPTVSSKSICPTSDKSAAGSGNLPQFCPLYVVPVQTQFAFPPKREYDSFADPFEVDNANLEDETTDSIDSNPPVLDRIDDSHAVNNQPSEEPPKLDPIERPPTSKSIKSTSHTLASAAGEERVSTIRIVLDVLHETDRETADEGHSLEEFLDHSLEKIVPSITREISEQIQTDKMLGEVESPNVVSSDIVTELDPVQKCARTRRPLFKQAELEPTEQSRPSDDKLPEETPQATERRSDLVLQPTLLDLPFEPASSREDVANDQSIPFSTAEENRVDPLLKSVSQTVGNIQDVSHVPNHTNVVSLFKNLNEIEVIAIKACEEQPVDELVSSKELGDAKSSKPAAVGRRVEPPKGTTTVKGRPRFSAFTIDNMLKSERPRLRARSNKKSTRNIPTVGPSTDAPTAVKTIPPFRKCEKTVDLGDKRATEDEKYVKDVYDFIEEDVYIEFRRASSKPSKSKIIAGPLYDVHSRLTRETSGRGRYLKSKKVAKEGKAAVGSSSKGAIVPAKQKENHVDWNPRPVKCPNVVERRGSKTDESMDDSLLKRESLSDTKSVTLLPRLRSSVARHSGAPEEASKGSGELATNTKQSSAALAMTTPAVVVQPVQAVQEVATCDALLPAAVAPSFKAEAVSLKTPLMERTGARELENIQLGDMSHKEPEGAQSSSRKHRILKSAAMDEELSRKQDKRLTAIRKSAHRHLEEASDLHKINVKIPLERVLPKGSVAAELNKFDFPKPTEQSVAVGEVPSDECDANSQKSVVQFDDTPAVEVDNSLKAFEEVVVQSPGKSPDSTTQSQSVDVDDSRAEDKTSAAQMGEDVHSVSSTSELENPIVVCSKNNEFSRKEDENVSSTTVDVKTAVKMAEVKPCLPKEAPKSEKSAVEPNKDDSSCLSLQTSSALNIIDVRCEVSTELTKSILSVGVLGQLKKRRGTSCCEGAPSVRTNSTREKHLARKRKKRQNSAPAKVDDDRRLTAPHNEISDDRINFPKLVLAESKAYVPVAYCELSVETPEEIDYKSPPFSPVTTVGNGELNVASVACVRQLSPATKTKEPEEQRSWREPRPKTKSRRASTAKSVQPQLASSSNPLDLSINSCLAERISARPIVSTCPQSVSDLPTCKIQSPCSVLLPTLGAPIVALRSNSPPLSQLDISTAAEVPRLDSYDDKPTATLNTEQTNVKQRNIRRKTRPTPNGKQSSGSKENYSKHVKKSHESRSSVTNSKVAQSLPCDLNSIDQTWTTTPADLLSGNKEQTIEVDTIEPPEGGVEIVVESVDSLVFDCSELSEVDDQLVPRDDVVITSQDGSCEAKVTQMSYGLEPCQLTREDLTLPETRRDITDEQMKQQLLGGCYCEPLQSHAAAEAPVEEVVAARRPEPEKSDELECPCEEPANGPNGAYLLNEDTPVAEEKVVTDQVDGLSSLTLEAMVVTPVMKLVAEAGSELAEDAPSDLEQLPSGLEVTATLEVVGGTEEVMIAEGEPDVVLAINGLPEHGPAQSSYVHTSMELLQSHTNLSAAPLEVTSDPEVTQAEEMTLGDPEVALAIEHSAVAQTLDIPSHKELQPPHSGFEVTTAIQENAGVPELSRIVEDDSHIALAIDPIDNAHEHNRMAEYLDGSPSMQQSHSLEYQTASLEVTGRPEVTQAVEMTLEDPDVALATDNIPEHPLIAPSLDVPQPQSDSEVTTAIQEVAGVPEVLVTELEVQRYLDVALPVYTPSQPDVLTQSLDVPTSTLQSHSVSDAPNARMKFAGVSEALVADEISEEEDPAIELPIDSLPEVPSSNDSMPTQESHSPNHSNATQEVTGIPDMTLGDPALSVNISPEPCEIDPPVPQSHSDSELTTATQQVADGLIASEVFPTVSPELSATAESLELPQSASESLVTATQEVATNPKASEPAIAAVDCSETPESAMPSQDCTTTVDLTKESSDLICSGSMSQELLLEHAPTTIDLLPPFGPVTCAGDGTIDETALVCGREHPVREASSTDSDQGDETAGCRPADLDTAPTPLHLAEEESLPLTEPATERLVVPRDTSPCIPLNESIGADEAEPKEDLYRVTTRKLRSIEQEYPKVYLERLTSAIVAKLIDSRQIGRISGRSMRRLKELRSPAQRIIKPPVRRRRGRGRSWTTRANREPPEQPKTLAELLEALREHRQQQQQQCVAVLLQTCREFISTRVEPPSELQTITISSDSDDGSPATGRINTVKKRQCRKNGSNCLCSVPSWGPNSSVCLVCRKRRRLADSSYPQSDSSASHRLATPTAAGKLVKCIASDGAEISSLAVPTSTAYQFVKTLISAVDESLPTPAAARTSGLEKVDRFSMCRDDPQLTFPWPEPAEPSGCLRPFAQLKTNSLLPPQSPTSQLLHPITGSLTGLGTSSNSLPCTSRKTRSCNDFVSHSADDNNVTQSQFSSEPPAKKRRS